LAHEKPGQTLQTTALVHEAYLRLVGKGDEPKWEGRGHFFAAAAAEAMRPILVENARRKGRAKHGGGRRRVDLDSQLLVDAHDQDLEALDEVWIVNWASLAAANLRSSSYTSGRSSAAADGSPESICNRIRVTADIAGSITGAFDAVTTR
jgi:hypothetical protein